MTREDSIEFNISGVQSASDGMSEENAANKTLKEQFVDYVQDRLAPAWVSAGGETQINDLIGFADGKYQEYIDYLDQKISGLEAAIPNLHNIDNA